MNCISELKLIPGTKEGDQKIEIQRTIQKMQWINNLINMRILLYLSGSDQRAGNDTQSHDHQMSGKKIEGPLSFTDKNKQSTDPKNNTR